MYLALTHKLVVISMSLADLLNLLTPKRSNSDNGDKKCQSKLWT